MLSGWNLIDEDVTVAREEEVADFKGLIRIIVKGPKETNDRDPGVQCKTACLVWGGHSEGQFFGKVIQFVAETKFQFCVNSSIDFFGLLNDRSLGYRERKVTVSNLNRLAVDRQQMMTNQSLV